MSYFHHFINISIFSSETIGPFGTKLGRNIPWVDLYKVFIFGGSNLKTWPPGPMMCSDWLKFQRTPLKPLDQLNCNLVRMMRG
jgi:hypothetical protein